MLTYSQTRSVDPARTPVTLDELKDHLAISDNDQDDRLSGILSAAITEVEKATRRALITQTWVLRLDAFPSEIVLPRAPLQSVTSITYIDTDGNTQTLDTSVYDVDIYSEPGIVRLAYAQSWPSIRGDARGVVVTYVAGYGDSPSDVPQELREAVKLAAQLHYDCPVAQLVNAYDRIVALSRVGEYP